MQILGIPITKRRLAVTGGAMVASFLGGAGVGFLVGKYRYSKIYSELTEKEIQDAKEYYARRLDTDARKVVTSYMAEVEEKEFNEILEKQRYISAEDEIEASESEDKVVTKNVFQGPKSEEEWDYEKEAEFRADEAQGVYIIHHDEFMENEPEFEQITLTYFEEDDVLADDKDEAIPDQDRVVHRTEFEQKFGHGSKDNNIVYVRNENLNTDFEILRSTGSYAREVLGFLEHSDEPRIRKFRRFDD